MNINHFNSDKWLEDKKLELINIMFDNEFGIKDFRNTTKIINFDELQTQNMKDRINHYRKAMGALFKAEDIRSILDYYYIQQDKKPVLNLLKQILKYYNHEFSRTSEYQGNYGGKKIYKSRYSIVAIKPGANTNNDVDDQTLDESQQNKRNVITKLVKTYTINTGPPPT